jgi:glycosyltransferase involved in cell wall biosynthesis
MILASLSLSLLNFRGPLLRALRERGHEVIAGAPEDEGAEAVREELAPQGIHFEPVPLARGGLNPLQDFGSLRALHTLLRRHRPDVLFAYTAKPVIYGGLAAGRVGGARFLPMITGLGYAFTEGGGPKRRLVRALVEALYRRALAGAEAVIFQNPDDERLFRALGLVPERVPSVRVCGSGVDLEAFAPAPLPAAPVFLMLARLVADKGVREYVEAACIVKRRFPGAVFQLGGGLDPNPSGVKAAELQTWQDSGVVDYLGNVDSVQTALAACRFYVLPSYREGTPRSVLEALATGRPVITTDAPGCRETVVHGENGLLVPPRDAPALAAAMIQLLETPDTEIQRMAQASLALACEKYDVHKVNKAILEAMGL